MKELVQYLCILVAAGIIGYVAGLAAGVIFLS